MSGPVVIVCGGRGYRDAARVADVLGQLQPRAIWHGGADGADYLAHLWAEQHDVPRVICPAEWHVHGRAAGPIRNQRMLDESGATVVVAFPGGRGTADMVRRAKGRGLDVREIAKSAADAAIQRVGGKA